MNKHIKTSTQFLYEKNQIEVFRNSDLSKLNSIEGKFLNKQQAQDLQNEIESNYIDGDDMMKHFTHEKDDIRMSVFNYDNPIAQKDINGVNLRIVTGLIRDNRKTYLLYANGEIIGEFYSVADIKSIIKHIEDNLIKSIE